MVSVTVGVFAYNLIWWATFRLQKVKKQRERWTTKARKGKDEKEDKTLKREKPPHQVWGFSGSFLTIKLGKFWKFDLFWAHWLRLWPGFYTEAETLISEEPTRMAFQKGGFGGSSPRTKTGTRVHSDVPPERKPERGYIRMFPRNENRNEGTFTCSPGTKTGTRVRSPKPPFQTALLSPSDNIRESRHHRKFLSPGRKTKVSGVYPENQEIGV